MSRSNVSGLIIGGTNTVWSPNSALGGAMNVIQIAGTGTGGGGATFQLTTAEYNALQTIEQNYTSQTANQTYENVPTSFINYLKLYQQVLTLQTTYRTNAGLELLLKITGEALTGSLNAFGLNTQNVELGVQNTYLQGVIEEMLSQQNVNSAYADITGTMSMDKTFALAPLFMYYIKQYGVPEPYVGFDPNRLVIVLTALENSGIDPYN
jgi:hypothetical protein